MSWARGRAGCFGVVVGRDPPAILLVLDCDAPEFTAVVFQWFAALVLGEQLASAKHLADGA